MNVSLLLKPYPPADGSSIFPRDAFGNSESGGCFTRATVCYNNNSYKYSAAMGLQCEKWSGDCRVSLVPSLLAPPGEKRSGE